MLDNGADINAIKELLGHSSLNATQVYTHNSIEKIKNIDDVYKRKFNVINFSNDVSCSNK